MKKHFTALLSAWVLCSTLNCYAQNWRSSLYPENWTPPTTANNFYTDAFLQDYSYAGYKLGEVPLPTTVPGATYNVTQAPFNADNTGASDATNAIQNAISAAASAGGGTVYLPSGTYRISPGSRNHCLSISSNNVMLKGDGVGQTFIFNNSNDMWQKTLILIAPSSADNWWANGNNETTITADLNGPTKVIPVSSVANYNVGDYVIVRNSITTAWVTQDHQEPEWNTDQFKNSRLRGIMHYRRVEAVNSAQNTITIDAPIRYTLKTRDNARVYKAPNMLHGVALQDFSIGNRNITDTRSSWYDSDGTLNNGAHTGGGPAAGAHQCFVLTVRKTRDAWIKNVHTYKPTVNQFNVHMLSGGVFLDQCRGLTLDNVQMRFAQYGGHTNNGYGYRIEAQDILIKNSLAEVTRHGFVMSHMHSHGNVLHRITDKKGGWVIAVNTSGQTRAGSNGSDFHMWFSPSCLIDEAVMDDSRYYLVHRRGVATMHNAVTAHSTVWNIEGNHSSGFVAYTSQNRYGYIVGTKGSGNNVGYQLDGPGSGVTFRYDTDGSRTAPIDFVQGIGQGNTLQPQSLYLDQLTRRTNNGGGNNPDPNEPISRNPTDDIYTENGVVYNTQELRVENDTRVRKSYLKFDLTDLTGNVESANLKLTATSNESGHGTFNVYLGSNVNWSENSTSILPSEESILGSFTGNIDANQLVTFPLNNLPIGETVTLIIYMESGGNDAWFASREGSSPPVLEISLENVPIQICNITASSDDGNVPANTIDGDFNTRWSANGIGEWIVFDLCDTFSIKSVNIAWAFGNTRQADFDLQVSNDNVNWSTVYSGLSSGTTLGFENFDFSNALGRYVRYYGRGNTNNLWNSITEFNIDTEEAIGNPPSVSFTLPSGDVTVEEGYSLTVNVNASDTDGTIENVRLYIDEVFIRQENEAPYDWGHTNSPNVNELNGLTAGVYVIKAVATDNDGLTGEAQITLTVTPASNGGGSEDVTLHYQVGTTSPTTNAIRANFRIYNLGSSNLAYNDLKVRYYFTAEGSGNPVFNIDYAAIGNANVSGNFVNIGGNNYYAEVSFGSGAGNLASGVHSGDIKIRITYSNWATHDETNDYSYDGSQTSFALFDKITVHQSGSLVWGIAPGSGSRITNDEVFSENDALANNLNDHETRKLLLYPNPVNDAFTIELPDSGQSEMFVYNLSGHLVYHASFEDQKLIPRGTVFNSGLYLLKILNAKGRIYTQKLIFE